MCVCVCACVCLRVCVCLCVRLCVCVCVPALRRGGFVTVQCSYKVESTDNNPLFPHIHRLIYRLDRIQSQKRRRRLRCAGCGKPRLRAIHALGDRIMASFDAAAMHITVQCVVSELYSGFLPAAAGTILFELSTRRSNVTMRGLSFRGYVLFEIKVEGASGR